MTFGKSPPCDAGSGQDANRQVSAHVLNPLDNSSMEYLRGLLDARVHLTQGPELPDDPGYDILIAGRPAREHLTVSSHLDAVIIPWSGLPPETRELLLEFPQLDVYNLHDNAGPVAEMAVALLLAATKFMVPVDRALRSDDWSARYGADQSVLLSGKTALVLGYGAVGREVSKLCQAFGMRVLATRRSIESPMRDGVADIQPAEALHDLLPRADVVMICLPLTEETDNLVGEAELALLPADAVLVNVARGAIVDELALYRALREGTLLAAGLDVWYNYPADESERLGVPPSAYPFRDLDNVVLSPHRAGMPASPARARMRMEALAELLNAAACGRPMPNRVDVRRGY
jgi:phosphoglycerate dehydrogenase-like enzyme